MWLAVLPPEHNPFLDEHLIYGTTLLILANTKTKFSLTNWWEKQKLVRKYKLLS